MKATKRLLIIATVMSALTALYNVFGVFYIRWFFYMRPDVTPQLYPSFTARMNRDFYAALIGSGWFIVMTTLLLFAILRLRKSY